MGPLMYLPPHEIALLAGPSEETAERDRFVVFDVVSHARTRHRQQSWTLLDCVADAIASATQRVRHVQILVRPMGGLPRLQITLTPASVPRGHLALPVDLRSHGLSVCTVEVWPGMTTAELVLAISACDRCSIISGLDPEHLCVQDSNGRQWDRLDGPLSDLEWLVFVARAPGPLLGAIAQPQTTCTTTAMQSQPPCLLGHEQTLSPQQAQIPFVLLNTTISPAEATAMPGARLPIGQLCMFRRFR